MQKGAALAEAAPPNTSELQPESKLYVSLAPGLCTGDFAELRVLAVIVRQAELRSIGEIERFSPELELPALREPEVLGDREVHVAGRRSVIRLEPQIALSQRCGRREIRDVEPLARIPSASGRRVWILARNQVRVATRPDTLAAVRPDRE